MTLSDFITKFKGSYWDFDQAFGAQCFDLFQFYNRDVVGGSFVSGNGAVDIWNTYPQALYEKFKNTPDNFPKAGDVVVWGTDYGKYGHVAICIEGDKDKFTCLSQNDPTGSPAIIKTYTSWTGVLGWLRPKQTDTALQACLTQHEALVTEIEAVKKEYKEAANTWSIERASLKQNIVNRDETISRVEKQVIETKKAWDTDHEALIKTITDSEKGTATLKDAIGTLEKRLKNEEADRHALTTINAELEAKNAGLLKQISEGAIVDYKSLSLKERIKICVDIIFA